MLWIWWFLHQFNWKVEKRISSGYL
jgi:hypothetical protein